MRFYWDKEAGELGTNKPGRESLISLAAMLLIVNPDPHEVSCIIAHDEVGQEETFRP